jgi:hypothetical protein
MLYEVASRRQATFSCCPSGFAYRSHLLQSTGAVHRVAFLEHRGDDVVAGADLSAICAILRHSSTIPQCSRTP